ncbi:hypothetical protein EV363DRAFT_1353677 [Boletus edulis]|uniref:Uncharacterized protein n=1 Tax=Boletus edulis BED1 TaxID=1328754 RepID=A0AAD4BB32_BOLED|nr:hypothetical protein EV363DRAFT_1353677 [Boletus edulis]KAF8415250.1 hypothetical protein L210DRAFT_3587279 [Boletus edulis BED1]KAF8442153.1 hypothetical protein L210DRAFT_3644307 [Boletus edulis BED1]
MSNKSSNSGDFTYTGSGTNSQGNHYCSRDHGSAGTGYHYSNTDGSYYYKNPDSSKYYNNGKGFSQYTSPSGHKSSSSSK